MPPDPSPALERLISFLVARKERDRSGPAYPEDVAEAMEYDLSDGQLAVICGADPGPPAFHAAQSLSWSPGRANCANGCSWS